MSLLRAPGPLTGSGLQHRQSFRPAIRSRPVRCQNTTDANADLKVRVKNAVEGAGFRSDVSWEDFLGDRLARSNYITPDDWRGMILRLMQCDLCRSEKIKDGSTVTWPSEKVHELWKVRLPAGLVCAVEFFTSSVCVLGCNRATNSPTARLDVK